MPAAATCDSILIPNSNKAAGPGTGAGTHGGTVAVTWSASVTLRSLMRSRAACAPVCCRRKRPEYPRCSRQWCWCAGCPLQRRRLFRRWRRGLHDGRICLCWLHRWVEGGALLLLWSLPKGDGRRVRERRGALLPLSPGSLCSSHLFLSLTLSLLPPSTVSKFIKRTDITDPTKLTQIAGLTSEYDR